MSEKTKKKSSYFKGVRSEFKKIDWPSKSKLINYTAVVVAMSLVVSLIVWSVDTALRTGLGLILK